jgi:hypothetical protein
MINAMKKVKLSMLFFAIAITTTAQTNEGVKTFFGNGKPEIGYFLSPSCQIGSIAGSTAVMTGIGAGILFNSKYYLGLNYKFITTENTPVGELDNRLYLDQRYFGLRFEYAIQPKSVVHFNFPVEFGVGETELDLKDSYENEGLVPTNDAWFAYLEPGVALEINLHKYIKLNISGGYRFVSNVSFRNLTEKDIMGISCSARLKIGIF